MKSNRLRIDHLKFVIYILTVNLIIFMFEYYKISVNSLNQNAYAHKTIIDQYFAKRKDWLTSNLGTILFKNADSRFFLRNKDKIFLIYVRPHTTEEKIRFFNIPNNTLQDCSVKNCRFSDNSSEIDNADAVVVNIRNGLLHIPVVYDRNPNQIWILLTEEPPTYTFSGVSLTAAAPNISALTGIFNWIMMYRSDSDVPAPYGRTVPLPVPVDVNMANAEAALRVLVPFWDKKQFTVLATVIISNCAVQGRMEYLSKLRKHMKVEVEGRCFPRSTKRPRCQNFYGTDLRLDCKYTEEYIFYLAFENSSCRQYLSEKSFHHAYFKGAIPVIMGPPLRDCEKLLPPNSFLHVDNYKTPQDLIKHMTDITQNFHFMLSFHSWRKHFVIVNEHGFFRTRSAHYCRVCEALNYNDGEQRIYETDDLRLFLDEKLLCNKSYNGNYPECIYEFKNNSLKSKSKKNIDTLVRNKEIKRLKM